MDQSNNDPTSVSSPVPQTNEETIAALREELRVQAEVTWSVVSAERAQLSAGGSTTQVSQAMETDHDDIQYSAPLVVTAKTPDQLFLAEYQARATKAEFQLQVQVSLIKRRRRETERKSATPNNANDRGGLASACHERIRARSQTRRPRAWRPRQPWPR